MKYILSITFLLLALLGQAQRPADSTAAPVPATDSAAVLRAQVARQRQDSIRLAVVRDSLRQVAYRDSLQLLAERRFLRAADSTRYTGHPYLRFTNPERRISQVHRWEGKEGLFYGIVLLVLLFGLLRSAFGRYLSDLFRTYFRTTLRQRIIREQVANAPLPSLLFNVLFLLIGALLLTLLLRHYQYGLGLPFWLMALYCLVGLTAVYLVKFLVLKLFGWLLSARDATDTYIFIVFATNKVLGILLLPVLLGLAFATGDLYQVTLALCAVVVGGLFLYRFFLSFVTVQKLVQINLFHFLIYLCALEIAPLLLINKLLVQFFG